MQLIGYPPCSTCKKAAKWLSEHGHDLPMRDIKAQPPTLEELTEWTAAGPELKRWFNTSGQVYRALGLKDKLPAMPRGEQLALLAGDGMLVKRPILLLDDVLSELDPRRQEFVLNRIAGGQVFITCCEDDRLPVLLGGKVFHVKQGTISG